LVLNFEDAAYDLSEQTDWPAKPETCAAIAVALYESLQGVDMGKARVDLATIRAKSAESRTVVDILDLPTNVVSQLLNVLEVCLFGIEGDALSAQIKESFDLFTKEERMEKLKKSQSELFGGSL
jgi:hypothetical protein